MASSFYSQIPIIINLIINLRPQKILDIGKGYGKYGFLAHEYLGIIEEQKINPNLTLVQQSNVKIDAVEIDPDLMLPHLNHIYNNIFFGDINELKDKLNEYDLILMIDVIEHLNYNNGVEVLTNLLEKSKFIIVATPIDFFEQDLHQSVFENHLSHWNLSDFKKIAHVDMQKSDGGAIYLLSKDEFKIKGFGNSSIQKLKRIGRMLKNEI